MKKKVLICGLFLTIWLGLTGCLAPRSSETETKAIQKGNSETQKVNSENSIQVLEPKNLVKAVNKPAELGKNIGLAELDEEGVKKLMGTSAVALFFYDEKCSICTNMTAQLKKDKRVIPNDIVLVKVNFTKEKGLVDKYKVEIPGSWVFINKEGKEVARNSGIDEQSVLLNMIQTI